MSFSTADLAHLLLVITTLLIAAHTVGYLFGKVRQPKVIGEILAGLLLGPTLFGHVFPDAYHALFQSNQSVSITLSGLSYVGLLLLMFCSGFEIQSAFRAGERKITLFITFAGLIFPFALSLILLKYTDTSSNLGLANNYHAFLLVYAIAVAVTSIPVISRILFDLGLLKSSFSRIVLSAAVLEDKVLYVVLAIALSLVGSAQQHVLDLPHLVGLHDTLWLGSIYHLIITLAFLILAQLTSPVFSRWVGRNEERLPSTNNLVALLIIFMLTVTLVSLFMGITIIFGALVAGIMVSSPNPRYRQAWEVLKGFSFAFFVPLYFVLVGLKLDIVRNFDSSFFILFFCFACVVKLLSVYAGGQMAGESRWGSLNLAVAMNARGGPGIVLALVSLEAGIISESFYTSLVMLSILSSLLAGAWLNMVLKKGWPLR
jgi:Kef-type K+ transport system membrane component KefB